MEYPLALGKLSTNESGMLKQLNNLAARINNRGRLEVGDEVKIVDLARWCGGESRR